MKWKFKNWRQSSILALLLLQGVIYLVLLRQGTILSHVWPWNHSQRFSCLILPRDDITRARYHVWLKLVLWKLVVGGEKLATILSDCSSWSPSQKATGPNLENSKNYLSKKEGDLSQDNSTGEKTFWGVSMLPVSLVLTSLCPTLSVLHERKRKLKNYLVRQTWYVLTY